CHLRSDGSARGARRAVRSRRLEPAVHPRIGAPDVATGAAPRAGGRPRRPRTDGPPDRVGALRVAGAGGARGTRRRGGGAARGGRLPRRPRLPRPRRPRPDRRGAMDAVAALRAGLPVLLATDTVYGLASAPDEGAARRLYELKGR